jgi:hypothetical protein
LKAKEFSSRVDPCNCLGLCGFLQVVQRDNALNLGSYCVLQISAFLLSLCVVEDRVVKC